MSDREARRKNRPAGADFSEWFVRPRGKDGFSGYRQAFDYWVNLAPNRPKYVVLCNFDEFWVYGFDSAQYDDPLDKLPLDKLREQWS